MQFVYILAKKWELSSVFVIFFRKFVYNSLVDFSNNYC